MASQLDWFNTFLNTESGRRVWFELQQVVCEWYKDRPPNPDGQYVLDELIKMIRENCGLNTAEAKMELIKHESSIAAGLLDGSGGEKQGDKDLLETG